MTEPQPTAATPKAEPKVEKPTPPVILKCIYGNVVKIQNTKTMEVSTYALVNYTDEKLDQNRISNYTEIGRAIWAKEEGAVVTAEIAGKGKQSFKILSIENE